MELKYALLYAKALAEGINPNTGELFEDGHICNQVETVRVLYTLIQTIESSSAQPQAEEAEMSPHPLPPNAGTPWTEEEDLQLRQEFLEKMSIKGMCESHGRTRGAITARLKKLELVNS